MPTDWVTQAEFQRNIAVFGIMEEAVFKLVNGLMEEAALQILKRR
jgi:hypothetical protein